MTKSVFVSVQGSIEGKNLKRLTPYLFPISYFSCLLCFSEERRIW